MSFQDIGRKPFSNNQPTTSTNNRNPSPSPYRTATQSASQYSNNNNYNGGDSTNPYGGNNVSPSAKYSKQKSFLSGNVNGRSSSTNYNSGMGAGGLGVQPMDVNNGGGASNNEYTAASQSIVQFQVCAGSSKRAYFHINAFYHFVFID